MEPAAASPRSAVFRSLLLPAALLLLGAAVGWTVHRVLHPTVAAESEGDEGAAHKTQVVTGTAARGDLALAETFFGVVAAAPASVRTLSSRAGGLVLAVSVAPGQQVEAGQVLLRFDPAPLHAAVLAARSALAAAQNQRREFEAGGRDKATAEFAAAAAKAKVELQQAEADVARLQPLRTDGLIADKTLADAVLAAQKARAESEAGERALALWREHGAELQLLTLAAAEAAAQAAQQQAEAAAAEGDAKAPAAGRVLALPLRAGDRAEAGTALGSLLLDGRRQVLFSLGPAAATKIAVGAAVVFRDPLGRDRGGQVARVAAQVGADGLVEVAADIASDEPMLPGAYVHGEVETELLEDVVLVPAAAVMRLDAEDQVLVRRPDGVAHRVTVEVLGRRGDRVAVDGKLEAGARVVVEGGYNVPNGTQLEEAPPKAAADEDDDDEDAKKDEKGDKDAKDAKDAKKPGGEPKQEHK